MNYYHRNIEQHIIPAIGDIPLNKLTTRDLQSSTTICKAMGG